MATTEALPQPWADKPLPLIQTPMYETGKSDTFIKGASHMALLHNAVLRGFNTIYLQAPHVQPADYADFIGYSLTWFKFVKGHHDDEEMTLFPKVEKIVGKRGILDETYREHASFMEGLVRFNDYLVSLTGTEATFSGTTLVSIMDSFSEPFNYHFHSEISTLSSLASEGDFPEIGPIFAQWGKSSIMNAGTTDVVPFLFYNFDRTVEGGMWKKWPPMPAPILWGLINIGGWWHGGWWKFASCGPDGQPRKLYALPK